ncbi:hypothetical protein EDB83DRAFT_2680485 [Lactarius deliciosus]|nr:hypothetical protein EDB83DRAFT_2680485 [Lactarius deliciosus]
MPRPRVDPARTRDLQLTTEDGTTVTTAGHPDEPGMGSGAELWAWMGNGAAVQTSIDALHTTSHADAFLPTDDVPRLPAPACDAYTLRLCHATLPVGRVCTENLKPSRFFKLLPCCSDGSSSNDNRNDDHANNAGCRGASTAITSPMPPPSPAADVDVDDAHTVGVTPATNMTMALGSGDDHDDRGDVCRGPADPDAALKHVLRLVVL